MPTEADDLGRLAGELTFTRRVAIAGFALAGTLLTAGAWDKAQQIDLNTEAINQFATQMPVFLNELKNVNSRLDQVATELKALREERESE